MPKTVSFLLEEEQWNKLAAKAQQRGLTPNALAKEIVLAYLDGGSQEQAPGGDYAKRQDLLELARIVQTVMDRLDALEQKVVELDRRLFQQPAPQQYQQAPQPQRYQPPPPQPQGPIPPDVDAAPPGDPWAEFQGPGPKPPQNQPQGQWQGQDYGYQRQDGYGGYGYRRSYYRRKRRYGGYPGY